MLNEGAAKWQPLRLVLERVVSTPAYCILPIARAILITSKHTVTKEPISTHKSASGKLSGELYAQRWEFERGFYRG
jgi:hypothetical protein